VPVRVYIPTPYRQFTDRASHVQAEAASVGELLRVLAERYPGLGERILGEDGKLPGHLNVYVNQVEARSLQGEATALKDGDEVALIPAMAGGSAAPASGAPARGPLLSQEQLERYSRHIRLDEVGLYGQKKLLDSKVLIIGAGALGSAAAVYLAAAGVGTLGIVDGDRVDLSNLQRQILHFHHDVGRPKVQSARRHIEDINPDVRVLTFPEWLTAENALEIIGQFDVVVNGSDNFPTRYLVNDACVFLQRPLIDASILKWEGQATVYLPGRGCYRCLFPAPPPPGSVPSCAEGGVLGALAGHMGTLQAMEAVKVLLGVGTPLANRLILFDALSGEYQQLRWNRNPDCPVCGDHPTITELIDYEGFCGVPLPGHDGAAQAQAADGYELSPREVWERVQRGALLVDVRAPSEYGGVRIPGAEPAPLESLARAREHMDPEQEMIFVCRIGKKSAMAAELLRKAGFRKVYSLAGGIVAWMNEQLPVEEVGAR
jgi:molybdopterin/thiamine biosynthesis adenylyltransferase/rhodanese-related sulfurtransferase/molybdopterin converting factor small subunit